MHSSFVLIVSYHKTTVLFFTVLYKTIFQIIWNTMGNKEYKLLIFYLSYSTVCWKELFAKSEINSSIYHTLHLMCAHSLHIMHWNHSSTLRTCKNFPPRNKSWLFVAFLHSRCQNLTTSQRNQLTLEILLIYSCFNLM